MAKLRMPLCYNQDIVNKKKNLVIIGLIVLFLLAGAAYGSKHIEASKIIETGGAIALFAILFSETGLLVGFFLPGDTLIFAAGFFASQGKISITAALLAMFAGSVLGNMLGYEIGRRGLHKLFVKKDSFFFKKEYLEEAGAFYEKNGGKTILLARFIPIIRTFAPLVAGIAEMNYKKFFIYNLFSGLLWVGGVTTIGWWAGKVFGKFFNIDKYLFPAIILATLATFASSAWHLRKSKKKKETK